MRYLRRVAAIGSLIVVGASLWGSGCSTSENLRPPATAGASASGGSNTGGAPQGGISALDTSTGGSGTTGGISSTGGATSCSDPLQTMCSGTCVDTATDRQHCGSCSTACGATEICSEGVCDCPLSNPDGDAGPITQIDRCSGQCVDELSSTTHCGDCYTVCTPKRCIEGTCGCAATDIVCNGKTPCAAGDTTCAANGGCFDPMTSTEHCGDCATACATNEDCVAGQCVLDCAGHGLTDCGGYCADLQTDPAVDASGGFLIPANCGACGQQCPSNKFVCTNGECACRNPIGTRCGDLCVDLQTNTSFCGSCDNPCPEPGHDCVAGQCVCSATDTQCADGCFDTTSDATHCGDCNTACGAGSHCQASTCVCNAGLTSCSGGCTDTQSDPAHCGDCKTACGAGQSCTAGACQCGTGQDLCSDGQCYDLQTTAAHCGDCNTACYGQQSCVAGQCACDGGKTACGQNCVDAQNDAQNCGGCGNNCKATEMCQGGACKPSIAKVQSQAKPDNKTQLAVFIAVCNASSSSLSLSGITVKYWYTEDGVAATPAVAIDYAGGVTPTPTATAALLTGNAIRVDATSVLTITFGATQLAAGACTGALQIRIYPSDNIACCFAAQLGDTANGWDPDYSYANNATLTDNPKITAYSAQGLLIWGLEPALVKPATQ